MAEALDVRELKVNTLLCFTLNKLNKIDVNRIIKLILDNFDSADISGAKSQLLSDADAYGLNLPVYFDADQHDKEGQLDILFDAIGLLADKNSLERLPIYVVDDIDKIPCGSLERRELAVMVQKFDKMEAIMEGLRTALCTLQSHAIFASTDSSHVNVVTKAGPNQVSSAQAVTTGLAQEHLTPAGKTAMNDDYSAQSTTARAVVPARRKSATTALQALQTEQCRAYISVESRNDVDGGEFKPALSHRQKLRIRNARKELQQQTGVNTEKPKLKLQPKSDTHDRARTTLHLAIGKNKASNVVAARPFKRVLCIDNVDLSIHEPELTDSLTAMGVRVYSCFEVQARQTHWQRKKLIEPKHRTFRVCINQADTDILFNQDNLPSDITVSQWHFKHNKLRVTALDADRVSESEDLDETFTVHDIE